MALGFGVGRRQAITMSGLVSRPARIVGNAAMAPVATSGRTHGKRHQTDVRFGGRRWPERQLCEGELTPDSDWAFSLPKRLLPCRANRRYRPKTAGRDFRLQAKLLKLGQ